MGIFSSRIPLACHPAIQLWMGAHPAIQNVDGQVSTFLKETSHPAIHVLDGRRGAHPGRGWLDGWMGKDSNFLKEIQIPNHFPIQSWMGATFGWMAGWLDGQL